jgi:thiol:disulfide interchange protein
MKPFAVLLLALAPLTTASLAAQGPVKWETSLQAAMKRAKAEHKLILMDLWTEWCPPCRYLEEKVYPSPEGQAALRRVVPFSALVEKKDRTPVPEGTKLAGEFHLEAFPTLVILDANGKEIRRQVGAFHTGADFAAWLAK